MRFLHSIYNLTVVFGNWDCGFHLNRRNAVVKPGAGLDLLPSRNPLKMIYYGGYKNLKEQIAINILDESLPAAGEKNYKKKNKKSKLRLRVKMRV
jgi:hypothetical protein